MSRPSNIMVHSLRKIAEQPGRSGVYWRKSISARTLAFGERNGWLRGQSSSPLDVSTGRCQWFITDAGKTFL